jgi:hypothetical protein
LKVKDVSGEYVTSIFEVQAKQETDMKQVAAGFLLGLFFNPEDGADIFLRKVD